jgi:curved DNA-binding protein CbpA
MDFYELLGVPADAGTDAIKRAFRLKAFEHHPDATQDAGGEAGRHHFQRVLEAYEVLRDPGKRAQYDALRRAGFPAAGDSDAGGGPWGQRPGSGGSEDDWERAFDEWLRRQGDHWGDSGADSERARRARERMGDTRRARAAAWEEEKAAAAENKVRGERVRWRALDAKHARQAAVLRRFWQTHTGLTWHDAAVGALFVAGSVGLACFWRGRIIDGAEEQPLGRSIDSNYAGAASEQPAAAAAAAAAVPRPP